METMIVATLSVNTAWKIRKYKFQRYVTHTIIWVKPCALF